MAIMLSESHPLIRRVIRFAALPYCYVKLVNWHECTSSRIQVILDLLYIFFRLKYFPYNYSLCRLWDKKKSEWHFYYGSIYDPFQRSSLRKEVHPLKFGILYQDKSVCYSLCKAENIPVPLQFAIISPGIDYKKVITNIYNKYDGDNLIVKPVNEGGGKGIFLLSKKGDGISVRSTTCDIEFDQWQLLDSSVVQEYLTQHKELAKVAKSINTVRIVTLLKRNGEVVVVGALMRFGTGNAFLDNTSQGGISVGITIENGYLKETGHDFASKQYKYHPTSLIEFKSFQVPNWMDVVSLAKEVQKKIPYCKLLGQDIAITTRGPVLIEINDEYDNVGIEQACGPIFANEEVWKIFKDYGLFINKYQEKLY